MFCVIHKCIAAQWFNAVSIELHCAKNSLISKRTEKVMSGSKTVLVLGATGGIGGELARQLRDAGWEVWAMKRGAAQAVERGDGLTWVRGDALNRQDVLDAAKG